MSQRAWTNSARRLRLASESRSWAWSDFFLNGIPSAAAPATGAGFCSQGQTFSATPPAVRLRSHPHGRVATRPAVARQSGVWDQAGNSLSRSAQCASAPRKSSKPSPGSRRSARPTRPGYPCPGRRPPVASAANHPNKVAPSSCARKVAIATIHHREKCSSEPLLPAEGQLSLELPTPLNPYLRIALGHQPRKLLAPLNDNQIPFRSEQFVEAQRCQLSLRLDAVEIDVIERHLRPAVFVDERKRWAGDVVLRRRLESFGDSLHQRGLPCPQVAMKDDHAQIAQFRSQLAPQRDGFLRRVGDVFGDVHPLMRTTLSPAQLVDRRNASGNPVSRSVATSECSPTVSAATSPANPCRCTAATAARAASFGICARTPAVIPVRISPVPPVAIPGFPVGFTHADPSGSAMTVRLPFNTSTSLCSRAKVRATFNRSACTALVEIPASRAISPGCGVSTSARVLPSSSSVLPSNAFSPSASITSGDFSVRTVSRTNSTVSGCLPIPGPIATTVMVEANCKSMPLLADVTAMPPVSVSGSGSVISSAANAATFGSALLAVATVTSPAPARSAAIPAIAAAPDFPSDPPTISTWPYMPLLLSRGRGASSDAKSRAVVTSSFNSAWIAASGEPIGATITGPRVSCPNTCAGRGAVKVTMASARVIPSPDCSDIASESAPEGMSTATTGLPLLLIAAIASA